MNTEQTLLIYKEHLFPVLSVAWSPSGTHIASGDEWGTVHLWDAMTGSTLHTYFAPHSEGIGGAGIESMAWSPDGTRLALGCGEGSIHVLAAHTWQPIGIYRAHDDEIAGIAWSPDGTHLATASYDRYACIWNATDGSRETIYEKLAYEPVPCITWSPDGRFVAATGYDGSTEYDYMVHVWDPFSGETYHIYQHPGEEGDFLHALAWSPSGTHIASGGDEGLLYVWDVSTGKIAYIYRGHTDDSSFGNIYSIAWSPDGHLLASAGDSGTVQLCRAENGEHLFTYTGHTRIPDCQWVRPFTWSPDSTRIASGDYLLTEAGRRGPVHVWPAV